MLLRFYMCYAYLSFFGEKASQYQGLDVISKGFSMRGLDGSLEPGSSSRGKVENDDAISFEPAEFKTHSHP
ncbi:hypothetical protein FGO68_gene5659 [Halteria grandinella]|uniref:Uncharacterized protein n=1 Tax=Halteria grandinella TaxID=5974 RepID=A0A8J8SU78_HALGN|nr:hypothetical protein FGO68_gene5659 [Halteria grandinella]